MELFSNIFKLFLLENNQESLVKESDNPLELHAILSGKKFSKRLKKSGVNIRLTKNGKSMSRETFERLCLDIWLETKPILEEI